MTASVLDRTEGIVHNTICSSVLIAGEPCDCQPRAISVLEAEGANARRPLLLEDDLDAYSIPEDDDFYETKTLPDSGAEYKFHREYIPARRLRKVLDAIIAAHQEKFVHIGGTESIELLWKHDAGDNAAALVPGKVRPVKDLWAHAYPDRKWIIWVSAGYFQQLGADPYDVEVSLAGLLLRTARTSKGAPTTVEPPIQVFVEEIAWYGAHSPDLQIAARALFDREQQLALPGQEEVDDDN
jgi:hypothetical protein